ncbi:MAG: hemerythrin domain-containing protein [Bryobacteraceae bacterium]|nr:hemerythrin domain-containing protein [Bryobacteraceae bacterium]MCX7603846.1 hemerythrin domain-containing protein [Bryobacteraceae bacterium]
MQPHTGAGLIELLLGEHGCILALVRSMERRLATMGLAELKGCGAALEAVLQAHAVEEDQLLFASLEGVPPQLHTALEAMYGEHEEMRRLLEELRNVRQAQRARSMLLRLIELVREHFAVEERVLFGLVRERLSEERLRELGCRYAQRRGVESC